MNEILSQHSVSVVVPCYKEVENIETLCQRIAPIAAQFKQFELLLVDDNSNDGTEELVNKLKSKYACLELYIRKNKPSLSLSVIEGFQKARYENLVCMDADLSHPPEKIPELIFALHELKADFALGSRFVVDGKTDDSWGFLRQVNAFFAKLFAWPLIKVKDPLSGFFCLRKKFFLSAATLNPIGYKIGLELMVKCHCHNVIEVPIVFMDRTKGESKLSFIHMLQYLQHVARLLKYKWFKSSQ